MSMLIPALGGALGGAGLIGLAMGLQRTATPESSRFRSRRLQRLRSMPRRTRLLLLAGFVAGIIAWLVTGWLLGAWVSSAGRNL